MLHYAFILLLSLTFADCTKNASISTATYSKVSKWGASNSEARSSGQSFFTQRSEADVRAKPNQVVYYGISRVGDGKSEKKEEPVLQERFNPPPYFDYSSETKDSKPSVVYGSPFQPSTSVEATPSISYDFPAFDADNKPKKSKIMEAPMSYDFPAFDAKPKKSKPMETYEVDSKPSISYDFPLTSYDAPNKGNTKNLYDSPISSYNPIPSGVPDNFNTKPEVPPKKFPAYVYDAPPEESNKYIGPYAPNTKDEGPPITQTIRPPGEHHFHHHEFEEHQGGEHQFHHHEEHEMPKHHHHEQEFPKHIPEFLEHDPTGKFPYSVPFNFDHHHVHHEITTTTTTEAPEDERVNKGHYSYYYLGRKLWYIPLYFSVYFIIYVTVLILKSIARHKVNFVHDWEKVKGRSLDVHDLETTTDNVEKSITNFRKRYYAM